MLPTTRRKVWFFWISTILSVLVLGLFKLGILPWREKIFGFLEGFSAAFLLSSILVSIHYLKTRTRAA